MQQYIVGLIDDDIVYQLAIDKYIRQKESVKQVIYYSNGEDAIDAFSVVSKPERQPDILLLDINMPIMDGWDFINEFRGLKQYIRKPIHIYILSSVEKPKDYELYEDANIAMDYIVKPIKYGDLKEILDSIFN